MTQTASTGAQPYPLALGSPTKERRAGVHGRVTLVNNPDTPAQTNQGLALVWALVQETVCWNGITLSKGKYFYTRLRTEV